MKVPCKGCEKRSIECHAECEAYKKYRKENEVVRKNKKHDNINRSTIFRANHFQ